jgi:hypothetical protein
MLLSVLLTLALASLGDALGLCDTLIEEFGEDNSVLFCYWLTNTAALSPFNNETSGITVLAFNDTGYMAVAPSYETEKAATRIQYYMVKGIHPSSSFPNDTALEPGELRSKVLHTFLDGGIYANQTGGQKILARATSDGVLEFTGGGTEFATTLKTVSLTLVTITSLGFLLY